LGLTVVVGALVGSVFVVAQPAARTSDDGEQVDSDDSTPPERYVPEAEQTLSRMRATMQKGLDEVKKARQDKDSVRLLCVNEPVAAMKGVLRVAENANVDLQEAVATGEQAQARREFRKIRQGHRQMDNLLTQAQNCTGVSSTESTTSVDVEFDPEFLVTDPYYGSDSFFYDPTDDVIDGEADLGERDPQTLRPPPASGIL
jgi:pyruvate/2-oxoglutarate dehydrogenase complex dihydrolipoamide acyltransferase (E2) component